MYSGGLEWRNLFVSAFDINKEGQRASTSSCYTIIPIIPFVSLLPGEGSASSCFSSAVADLNIDADFWGFFIFSLQGFVHSLHDDSKMKELSFPLNVAQPQCQCRIRTQLLHVAIF